MRYIICALLLLVPQITLAQSSASFKIENPNTVPAVGQSSGSQFKIQGALATMAGQMSSAAFKVDTGPALVTNPTTSTSGGGGGVIIPSTQGTGTPVTPFNVEVVDTSENGALIYFETNVSVRAALQYKKKGQFDPVQIPFSQTYSKTHVFSVDDLEPGTTYQFLLFIEQQNGDHAAFGNDSYIFTTKSIPDLPQTSHSPLPQTPPNSTTTHPQTTPSASKSPVKNFWAISNNGEVHLSWNIPFGTYDHVDIYRSEDNFLIHPGSEEKIYSGKDNQTNDSYVTPGKRYYYTIFVYDAKGNVITKNIARTEVPEDIINLPDEPTINQPAQIETEENLTYTPTNTSNYMVYMVVGITFLFIVFLIIFVLRKKSQE